MKRWQAIVILILLVLPVVVYVGVGSWALWQTEHVIWMWMLLPAFWGLAVVLARAWRTPVLPLRRPRFQPPPEWTSREHEAWALVTRRLSHADTIPTARLGEITFYHSMAQELATEIARHYHPKAADPYGSLTVLELLTAAELAAEDLAIMVDRYVPGSHLLTINHWKMLGKLPTVTRTLSKLYWPISAMISPTTVIGRYAASRILTEPALRSLQTNVLSWFYAAFVQRVGYYAIELNSGRLRHGAASFRAMSQPDQNVVPPVKPPTASQPAAGTAPPNGSAPGSSPQTTTEHVRHNERPGADARDSQRPGKVKRMLRQVWNFGRKAVNASLHGTRGMKDERPPMERR